MAEESDADRKNLPAARADGEPHVPAKSEHALDQIELVKDAIGAVNAITNASKATISNTSEVQKEALSSFERISGQEPEVLKILSSSAKTPEERARIADSFDRHEEQKTRRIEAVSSTLQGFFSGAWKVAGIGAIALLSIASGSRK